MTNMILTPKEYEHLQELIVKSRNDSLYFCTGYGSPKMIKFYRDLFDKFGINWEDCLSNNERKFFQENPDGDTRFPDYYNW